jgi:hypothetical protein
LFRPHPAERVDPAVPAAREGYRLLQHISAAIPGNAQDVQFLADAVLIQFASYIASDKITLTKRKNAMSDNDTKAELSGTDSLDTASKANQRILSE